MHNIIFDLDGTLLNVDKSNYELHATCCKESNLKTLPYDKYYELKRLGTKEAKVLQQEYGLKSHEIDTFISLRNHLIETEMTLSHQTLKPSAISLLELLKSIQCNLYLATFRRNYPLLMQQLNELGLIHYFSKIGCRGNYQRYDDKTKLTIIRDFQLGKQEFLLIGDTEVDFHTALEAKMPCIILKDGIFDEVFLKKTAPKNKYYSLNEVKELFGFVA